MQPIQDFQLVDKHDDWWTAVFSTHGALVDEAMAVTGQIRQQGERVFDWVVIPTPHGAEIASGTAVSFKQARFLALEAWHQWLSEQSGGFAPRTTL